MNPGEKYDDNMLAYMTMTLGVDLTSYLNTELSFKLLYDTEDGYDSLKQYESYDGVNWSEVNSFTGYDGWISINSSIISGGMYFVKFIFKSDYSLSDYEGVYIDDIEITGDPIPQPKPNLVYDFSYSIDGAIIISNEPNTVEDSDVYGGQKAYIDWGIINTGDTTASSFIVNLEVDGVVDTSWSINSLNSGASFSKTDYTVTLSMGWHNITIDIDPQNQIIEYDELDNWYDKAYFWITPEVSFSGTVNHLDLNSATGQMTNKSKQIKVMLMDKEPSTDRIIDETTTNNSGDFFFDNITNVDTDGTNLDLYIKLLAYNDAAYATSSLLGNIVEDISPVYNNIPPGNYDTTITVNTQFNSYFSVINTVDEARNKWLQLRSQNPLQRVQVVVSPNGAGTKYTNGAIWIESSVDNLKCYPDTYDQDVIYHEYIHRIQDIYDFFDNGGGPHDWMDTSNVMMAAAEGFANVFSVILRGDGPSLFHDYYDNYSQNRFFDMENGEYGWDNIVDASVNNFGTEVEASVAGIIWDIYDSQNDDYSTYGSSTYPNLSNPDNIGDNLSSQTTILLNTLLDKTVNGHHPDNIDEFWDAWFSTPSYGYEQEMKAIWYEHGILIDCCIGIRGNTNGDSQDNTDVSDLVFLVAYTFQNGPPAVCPEEADINGSGIIDISDLVAFVAFMFLAGADPASCF